MNVKRFHYMFSCPNSDVKDVRFEKKSDIIKYMINELKYDFTYNTLVQKLSGMEKSGEVIINRISLSDEEFKECRRNYYKNYNPKRNLVIKETTINNENNTITIKFDY